MKRTVDIFLSLACVGYIPYAPGTFASLVCSVFLLVLPMRSILFDTFLICTLILVSVALIYYYRPEEKDPRYVVIDEFIGMYVTMVGHRMSFLFAFAGFILFRFFDIMKPYPVRKLECLSGGWGIIADDIAAGIYANLSLLLLETLFWKNS